MSRSSISLWPDDTIDEAAPKLHKAAHFARRAIDVPNSVVLRGDNVVLCPDADTTVDVVRFEDARPPGARRRGCRGRPRRHSRSTAVSCCPQDRYEPWAEERREQLRLRHLDLLRLDGRWETVVELDASDELAHLALMRRHAANGDRHAALAPVRAHGPHVAA